MILLRFSLEDIAKDNGLDAGPLRRRLMHHFLEKSHEVLADKVGVLADLVVQYLVLKFVHFGCREWVAQAADLVEDDTERPNIGGWAILRIFPEFGR